MNIYRTLLDLKNKLHNKKVVIRIDANVPIVEGVITDDSRIKEALPSIKFILEEGASQVVILSHFGRPKNQEKEFSLIQIQKHFEYLLGQSIEFCNDFKNLPNAKVILCENLRYYKEEEKGDENFAQILANLGDFYINDAFSCSHRAHASISVVEKFKPVYAGFLMTKEITNIELLLNSNNNKSLAIVGGSKVSTKINLLKNLIKKVDYLFVAGGMANTFLYAQGFNVGASLCEKDFKSIAIDILEEAQKVNCQIILPSDFIVCKKIEKSAPSRMIHCDQIQSDDIIVDAGTQSVNNLVNILKNCDTFVWNGPLGIFEIPPFEVSTFMLAREVANLTEKKLLKSIIGGGDTASAVLESGFKSQMTYISTAGGAFLEWLEGKILPGVSACIKK
jgi:phosphoglycerate kinase